MWKLGLRKLFLIALGVLGFFSPILFAKEVSPATQIRVFLSDKVNPKKMRFPEGALVLASQGPLVLLQFNKPVNENLLKKIQRLPFVVAAERNYEVLPEGVRNEHASNITPTQRPPEECSLLERCSNGYAKHWGQKLMATDLMHQAMESFGMGSETTANVAVVDSGFDRSQVEHFSSVNPIRTGRGALVGERHPFKPYKVFPTYSGDEILGDPDRDTSGHGTMVSSVIVGDQGMGVARSVNLSVYRITEKKNPGSSLAVLDMGVLKACEENSDPDGLTIINLSWGGRKDEGGFKPDEEDKIANQVMERLAEKGCLLVKASGNANFREAKSFNLDDSYLRVAAVDPALGLSTFSTSGEIAAPGTDIFVRNSSHSVHQQPKERICGEKTNTLFVNGTSFASPLAAGIASQVVRVLKHEGVLKTLATAERIKLVNRILKASMIMGSINGLRAVKIAKLWADSEASIQSTALSDNGVSHLGSLLRDNPPEECTQRLKACENELICSDKKKCLDEGQFRALLCYPPKESLLLDLSLTSYRNKAPELGVFYNSLLMSSSLGKEDSRQVSEIALNDYLERHKTSHSLAEYIRKRDSRFSKITPSEINERAFRDMPTNLMSSTLLPYLNSHRYSASDKQHYLDILNGVLNSSRVKVALKYGTDPKTGEDRGSNGVLETVHDVIHGVGKGIGPQALESVLSTWIDTHLEEKARDVTDDGSFNGGESTAHLRVFDRLIKSEPERSRFRTFLENEELKILNEIRKSNEFHGEETQVYTGYSEIFPTRAVLQPLVERHAKNTEQQIRKEGLKAISPIESWAFLKNSNRTLPGLSRTDTLLNIFEQIANNQGWGNQNDFEMTESIFKEFILILKNSTEAERKEIENRFTQIMVQSKNPYLIGQLLEGYFLDRVFGVPSTDVVSEMRNDKEERAQGFSYKDHPLLNAKVMKLLGHKAVAALANTQEGDVPLNVSMLKLGSLGYVWKALGVEADWPKDMSITVPEVSTSHLPSRLTTPTPSQQTKIGEVGFNKYMENLFRLHRDRNSRPFANNLMEKLKTKGVFKYPHFEWEKEIVKTFSNLPKDGEWRTDAETFLADPDPNEGLSRNNLGEFIKALEAGHIHHEEYIAAEKAAAEKWEMLKKNGFTPKAPVSK